MLVTSFKLFVKQKKKKGRKKKKAKAKAKEEERGKLNDASWIDAGEVGG